MKLPRLRQNGFTLIELMVVISVLALISGIMIPSFSTYTRNQNLKQAQENLKSDLRSIQNKALTGTGSDKVDGSSNPAIYWGMSFTGGASTYSIVLTSTSCSSGVIETQTVGLPSGMTVGTGTSSYCYLFSMEDGSIRIPTGPLSVNPTSVPIVHTSSGTTRNINMYRTGLIYTP